MDCVDEAGWGLRQTKDDFQIKVWESFDWRARRLDLRIGEKLYPICIKWGLSK